MKSYMRPVIVVLYLSLLASTASAQVADEERGPGETESTALEREVTDSAPAYYGDVKVTAKGIKEGDESRAPYALKADVFINGRRVGTTPYSDGLPEGKYQIDVKFGQNQSNTENLDVIPGKTYAVEMMFRIPMSEAERQEWMQKQREKEQKRKETLRRESESVHREWEEMAMPIKKMRKTYLVTGGALTAGGVGLVIAGAVLAAKARDLNEEVDRIHDHWLQEIDPGTRADYADTIKDKEDSRDLKNGLGISFLAVGGAALATGVVFFIITPSLPDEPEPREGINPFDLSTLRLSPMVSSGFAGGELTFVF